MQHGTRPTGCLRRPSTRTPPLAWQPLLRYKPKRMMITYCNVDKADRPEVDHGRHGAHSLEHGHRLGHDSLVTSGRYHHSSTATHACATAIALARPDTSLKRSTTAQAQVYTTAQINGKTIPIADQGRPQQLQTSRFKSAYTFEAPSWHPLVGCSRQHMRIQKEVHKASQSTEHLFISGDAGLETLKLAATVHAMGLHEEDVSHPMVVVDCSSQLGAAAASQLLLGGPDNALLSASYAQASVDLASDIMLWSALSNGTLVLRNIDKAPYALLALADAAIANLTPRVNATTATAAAAAAAPGAAATAQPGSLLKAHQTRLVLISQLTLTQLLQQLQIAAAAAAAAAAETVTETVTAAAGAADSTSAPRAFASLAKCPTIAVPALRARPSDIGPLAVAAGQGTACLRGYQGIELSAAALKQLTSYPFPGNEAELNGLVQRAIMLHPPAPGAEYLSSFESPQCSCDGEDCCRCDCADAVCCGSGRKGCSTGQPSAPVLTLDAADFWAATGNADRARLDVLDLFPWLKKFILGTGLWPLGLNKLMIVCYPLVLLSLFMGPQDRESSAALTVFWAGWWPLVLLSFPLVGRAWCSICPFMITGEAAQDLVEMVPASEVALGAAAIPGRAANQAVTAGRTVAAAAAAAARSSGAQDVAAAVASFANSNLRKVSVAAARRAEQMGWELKRWPTETIEPWAGSFVAAAFAAILLWEHVWDLPGHAALSGWLLLMITGGAVVCSMVYEKRLWCRHFCPIGAMNGLFAKLSLTEIRSRPGLCAASGCSKPCFKGSIEQQVVEVAVPGSGCLSSATPFRALRFLSGILPWTHSNDSSTCTKPNSGGGSSKCAAQGTLPGASTCSVPVGLQPAASHSTGVPTTTGETLKAAAATVAAPVQVHQVSVKLPGCPINTHPGLHKDNHDCIMCGNCLRSCSASSAQWRLRPPAADLWGDHEASWMEVHLMNVLLGSVLLHSLPDICNQLGLSAEQLLSDKVVHILLSAATLAVPSAVSWVVRQAATTAAAMTQPPESAALTHNTTMAVLADIPEGNNQARGISWLRMSYSVLPLVWAGVLAYYETMLLTELGQTAPRLAISLGVSPEAPWLSLLPAISPAPAVVVDTFQGATLFLGAAFSMALASKIGSVEVQVGRAAQLEADQAVLAQGVLTALITLALWTVTV